MSKNELFLNKELLYVRELTEAEAFKINSAKTVSPMVICPDLGRIIQTGEEVLINHAYISDEGLNYVFEFANGKTSSLLENAIELINPKFNWLNIAKLN